MALLIELIAMIKSINILNKLCSTTVLKKGSLDWDYSLIYLIVLPSYNGAFESSSDGYECICLFLIFFFK